MNGPRVRSDIIDAYVFRRSGAGLAFLQLHRARPPMLGAWHPVMGHIEAGETAVDTLVRELWEETGLDLRHDAIGAWALEQVHPFFMADRNEIHLSPRFAVEVAPGWRPTLNAEHDDQRWVDQADATASFLWPGQHRCIEDITAMLGEPATAEALRLDLGDR